MSLPLLLFVAFALAVLSVIKNRNSDKTIGRREFIIAFLIVGAPAFFLTLSDINLMINGEKFVYSDNILQIMYVWFAVAAYPFYQRVCWRVNGAGARKFVSYICLVPYLNILALIYLCAAPPKSSE